MECMTMYVPINSLPCGPLRQVPLPITSTPRCSEKLGFPLHKMNPSQTHDKNNTPPPIEGSSIFGRCTKIVLNNCHITNCASAHSSASHNVHSPGPPISPLPQDDSNAFSPPPAAQSGATGPTRFGMFAIASGRRIVAIALTIALVIGFVLW
ncbi:hypothetical protein BKA70DRAFT_721301 [Coprinopsis sp. MPI-PUGE-AT-0042]|nr:hypothetical protein BKA70DRAFT_721301 [Coprinopsis sp. MPI-PUGE-AT-0042]